MTPTTSSETLVLTDVVKRYGGVPAADLVSLTIPGGSFHSLLGPSGSGKTTLLMIIAGFITPDAGTVTLGGRDLAAIPPEKRNFGMVFQGYALFPTMTVAENVAFPLAVRAMGRAERDARVRAALDLVQLRGFDERRPRQLSGGQQQRVALARALVFDPALVLLDEPLSALDTKLRAGLQVELRDLQRRIGKTFLCVTHDQEEALSMSDGIAIIRNGRVAGNGPPQALFERPATRFVADFLGESNFLEGVVAGADDTGRALCRVGDVLLVHDGLVPAPGQPVILALRPFRIDLAVVEPAGAVNRVVGRLHAWSYRGADFHGEVDTALGRLAISTPAWKAPVTLEPGRTLWLSWAADAAVVVADDR
jgi:ABC-type Fe3+/spermidine/putrescine transport system ATPase subunit